MGMADPKQNPLIERLLAENAELRQQLEEAQETVEAIQSGGVDAIVVREPKGNRVYTLETADRPYRLLVEQMQQGAVTLDADGTILYSNRRFAEMTGKPAAELIATSLADAITVEDRLLYERILREAQGGASQGEVSIQNANGSCVPAFITINTLPPDTGAALGALVTDLTAQKHQETLTLAYEALQTSETRFRALVETSSQIVWTTDAGGSA